MSSEPRSVYLDWNASAPVLPEVRDAVYDALTQAGNPSSIHRFGRTQRGRMEEARDAVAALVGGPQQDIKSWQVTFTSGGTEALALALSGLRENTEALMPEHSEETLPSAGFPQPRPIMISTVEHPAVVAAAHAAGGKPPILLPVTETGLLDMDVLKAQLDATADHPPVVAIQRANNETGVLQPMRAIADLVHSHGGLLICDAVQAAGKIPLSLNDLGADALTISAHKIGGLPGVGALIVARGRAVRPMIAGGGQERGLRGGTQNLPGIIAFGVAARHAAQALADGVDGQMARLRDRMQQEMQALAPGSIVYGGTVDRLPNTLSLGLPGIDQHRQVMTLDLAGIAVSAGSACSSGKVAPSPVLMAMGASRTAAQETIRLSLGPTTSEDDVDALIKAWAPLAAASIQKTDAERKL